MKDLETLAVIVKLIKKFFQKSLTFSISGVSIELEIKSNKIT